MKIFKIKANLPTALMKKLLTEEIKVSQLVSKLQERFKSIGFIEKNIDKLEEFAQKNYDLLTGSIKTVPPNVLLKNYKDFLLSESVVKKILREAEGEVSVDELDKIGLVQDISDIQGTLYDAFSRMYAYKDQYTPDDKLKTYLGDLRLELSKLIGKFNTAIDRVGLGDMNRSEI